MRRALRNRRKRCIEGGGQRDQPGDLREGREVFRAGLVRRVERDNFVVERRLERDVLHRRVDTERDAVPAFGDG